LRDRALAVFIDEAHVMVDPGGRWGKLMAQLAQDAPVAVGFTATLVVETCEVVAGRHCSQQCASLREGGSVDPFPGSTFAHRVGLIS